MEEAAVRALRFLGCLSGCQRKSKYCNNHYSPHNTGSNAYHYDISRGRGLMGKNRQLSLQIVELRVRMCCEGCKCLVQRSLHNLRGADAVVVDLPLEKVTVTGYVDRYKVLKAVRRSGKKAEFWPNPDLPRHFTSAANYFHDEESYRKSYNYFRHGYNNGEKHGNIPVSHRGEDHASNMFNDDDVNACRIS